VLTCLPLDPRFSSSNPVENNRYLRTIKIHSTIYIGEEVNSSVPCRIYGTLKIPPSMKDILLRQNSADISRQVSPVSLLVVSAGNFQIVAVDESEMI
jgi:hypothetical protein